MKTEQNSCTAAAYKKRSQFKTVAMRFSRNNGLMILLLFTVLILTVDLYIDYDTQVVKQVMADRNIKPFQSMEHPLGTDQYGRDLLARIIYGARYSLGASLVVILFLSHVPVCGHCRSQRLLWRAGR